MNLRKFLASIGFGIASALCAAAFLTAPAHAEIFGSVHGIVHDPQHRPIQDAAIDLKAQHSDWVQHQKTNGDGEFEFVTVPIGEYTVTVNLAGFQQAQQNVVVGSGTSPVLHFQLELASVTETTVVTGEQITATMDSVTPTAMLSRQDIQETPGADRTNSLAMITDFTPAAYVTHDMLHMRGGHQVEWLIDGIPIPNTNIAANLAPTIDPKDIDYLEVQRGSYDAAYGDRTYGIFNIVPRTGFERDKECDLVTSLGNFYQTNDQISCGGHTQRFAYYISGNGNRSNYGLQTPIPRVVHDAQNGYGGFGSLIFNPDAKNQLRLVTSLRQDYYQIPIDPDPNSIGNQLVLSVYGGSPSYGLSDGEHESDGYVAFTWVHTFNSKLLLTVSPFYHYTKAQYQASPNDTPALTSADLTSNYGGMQAALHATVWRNDIQAGVYGFGQHQNNYFENICQPPNSATCIPLPPQTTPITGGLENAFIDDKFAVTSWLTLIGGLRQTHFTANFVENAIDPRVGVALKVPHLNWVFRAFYGDYYQAPPLETATDALNTFASGQGFGFGRLNGERDEEHQFGVTIPYRGWDLDADTFKTRAMNWLDHNNIGESNIFWPITWYEALIQGWELTLRSPRLWHFGQFHLAYANQFAQATSPITGGLICPPATPICSQYPPPGYNPVDHDQRNTLNVGFNATLPWQTFASTNVSYGSGFHNGLYLVPNAPYTNDVYLPGHTMVDISLGKSFLEKYTVSVTALNVANHRVEMDNSLTFGGFHWSDPRQIYVEFRYRFHY
jgi:hypothetical protein